MVSHCHEIDELSDLRKYVHETLCHQNELVPGVFPVTERLLVRGENPCGLYFCLHGPRSVKLTAIWETDRNTILFYGSTGERQQRIRLTRAPRLEVAVPAGAPA